jgi:4-amino-4-deoxy-L-arabinose transferase-like glycosyltransferase
MLLWGAIALGTGVLCLLTLTISPPLWVDEAQIVEYGRVFAEPNTDWSLFWDGNRPIVPWYYVGPIVQNFARALTAPSCAGPRLVAIAGGIVASGSLAAWLFRRGTRPAGALLLSLLFLFDPNFVGAYRGGRLDGWTLACAFAGCYLLTSWQTRSGAWRLLAAGFFVVLGFFIWPSIAFLLPLLGLELIWVISGQSGQWKKVVVFAAGALATLVGLTLAAVAQSPGIIGDVPRQLAASQMSAVALQATDLLDKARTLFVTLFIRSPWNGPLLVACWRSGGSRLVLATMALPAILMFRTLLYGNRIIYLLVYLLVFFAGAFAHASGAAVTRTMMRELRWGFLVGGVICAGVISIGLRTANAWLQRDERNEELILFAAEKVGARGATVCLDAFEFYFAGRYLGWRLFSVVPRALSHCEIAIASSDSKARRVLETAGFRRQTVLMGDRASQTPVYGARGFGPYDVYRR